MLSKKIYAITFLLIVAILGSSIYLQVHDGFIPCPLCTLQRVCFVILGILSFVGIFIGNKNFFRRLIPFLTFASSAGGGVLAGRQVYLQMFSDGKHESCGVSLEYMFQVLPLNEAFQKIFAGSAECTQRGFSFLYLNMAQWSLLFFVGFCLMSLYLLFYNTSDKRRH